MTKIKHSCLLGLLALVCLSPVFAVSCNDKIICPDCVTLPSVSITLLETDDWSQCRVRFTPSEGTERFIYYIGQEEELSAFENGTLEGVDTLNTCKEQEVIFYDLELKKEYCIFARAYDSAGQPGGIAFERLFNKAEIKIEAQYITAASAGISIVMSDRWTSCRYHFGLPSDKDDFVSGKIEGVTVLEKERLVVNRFDLTPETDYVVYLIPVNRMGIEYDMIEYSFRTKATGSAADVTVEYPVRDVCMLEAKIVPNQYCDRIVAVMSLNSVNSAKLDTDYDGDIDALLKSLGFGSEYEGRSYNGNPLTISGSMRSLLKCDTKLELYIGMYDRDGAFLGAEYHMVSTPPFDKSAEEATAEVEIVQIVSGGSDWGVWHSVKALVTPNKHTVGYFVKMYEATQYENMLKQENAEDKIREQLLQDYSMSNNPFVYGNHPIAYINEKIYSWCRKNYIVVCPFNANGVDGWGPITAYCFEIE